MSASRRKFIKGLGAAALFPAIPAFAAGLEMNAEKLTSAASHRIVSCNIRVALDEDEAKGLGWSARRDICLQIIDERKADIIALQEVLKVQADDFRKYFSTFQLIGFEGPEMDAHAIGYHGIAKNPILFSNERYELLTAGTYWLSETPLVAGSKSWDTARARHVNWVRLKERTTGKELRVINLHLDHVSGEAKIQQAAMVAGECAQYQKDFPQLMAGDFNSRFDSSVFQSVRLGGWQECYETIHGSGEAGFTGHEFQGSRFQNGASKGRIDYIWYKGNVKPVGADIIKDAINGKYPSDHFFIQADVQL